MQRRHAVRTMLALGAAPLAASAQPAPPRLGRIVRIGWLGTPWGMSHKSSLTGFRHGMNDLGWREGRDWVMEVRQGERADAAALTAELVQAKVELIVTQGPMILDAHKIASTTPMVFAFSGDPVAAGLVSNLARPGGLRTGVTAMALELVGKRLELLKQAVPTLRRVALLANPSHAGEPLELRESQAAAQRLGLTLHYLPVRSPADLDAAFQAMLRERAEAISAFPDASINRHGRTIAEFAQRSRIPAISGFAEFAEDGNLMSYGPNFLQLWHRMASYADRILKGANAGDLPVEQPTSFELVINMNVAKALGLALPPALLLRADTVIT